MGRCKTPDCDGWTVYDDSAQVEACTTCGTVTSQDILADDSCQDGGFAFYLGPTTLKSLRRFGGVLYGQSASEDRSRRNRLSIHQYILNILSRLDYPGLALRCQHLFDRAKLVLQFRWGKVAVLIAGACIMIALRESQKGVTTSELSFLMDVPITSLSRAFYKLRRALNLNVPSYDPISFIPTVQAYLITLLKTSKLPKDVINIIQPLSQISIFRVAGSLSSLVIDATEIPSIGRFALPTACAIFVLAIEAEAATKLPRYVSFLETLATGTGTAKDITVDRYRAISYAIEGWTREIPWLADDDMPQWRKPGRRKRVAHSTKDVIQFQREIQHRKQVHNSPVMVTLEVDETDASAPDKFDYDVEEPNTGQKRNRAEFEQQQTGQEYSGAVRLVRVKRTRELLSPVDIASLSFLMPNHPLASVADKMKGDLLNGAFLSPTRLHHLLSLEGGEANVTDEELFDPEEWKEIFRTEEEVEEMRSLMGWEVDVARPPTDSVRGLSPAPVTDWQVWEDLANDKEDKSDLAGGDVFCCGEGEQILGEWKEASPTADHAEHQYAYDKYDW